jgi:NAD(P)H dehydrogenase (quinone)
MAKVPGLEERSQRMLTEYGAPTSADTEWADGIIFGTPTRFGNTSAELKAFIDSLGGLRFQGKLNGKAAGAFTSTAGPHGGNEATIISLYILMAHLGFIIVPNGHARKGCSGPRNPIWIVSGFRTERRPTDSERS